MNCRNLIPLEEVLSRLGIKRSTLYKRIKQGVFPKQIKWGDGNHAYYLESEIDAFFDLAVSGRATANPDAFRQLTDEIHRQREEGIKS